MTARRKDLGIRPNCPGCGAPNPQSWGLRWMCTTCGREWTKIHRDKVDYTTRPPCSYCGAYHSLRWTGDRYLCGDCGRTYKRNWQEREEMRPILEEVRRDAAG